MNSTRYLVLSALTVLVIGSACTAPDTLPELNRTERDWLAAQIFRNECNSDFQCLTSWNQGEDFPSLGIGHFIWYRQGQTEAFVESFPRLLQTYAEHDIALPHWLAANTAAPWQDREEFLKQLASPDMEQLRVLLASTMPLQIDLIIERLYSSLPKLLAAVPDQQQAQIQSLFYQIANSHPPFGIYALVDYVNFKGEGVALAERYHDQGWGLLQVLEAMPSATAADLLLEEFVAAASAVLTQRVSNAPAARNEQRWLQGWLNRLQTYLPQ